MSDVNYNTANALERWAMLRGRKPWLYFLAGIANRMMLEAGYVGHSFVWQVDEEAQAAEQAQQELENYKAGLISWHEMRQQTGRSVDQKDLAGQAFVILGGVASPFDPLAGQQPPAAPTVKAYGSDLRKLEAAIRKAAKGGRSPLERAREFRSDAIPAWRRRLVEKTIARGELGITKAKPDVIPSAATSARAKKRMAEGEDLWLRVMQAQAEVIRAEALEHYATMSKTAFETGRPVKLTPTLWTDVIDWLEILAMAGVNDSAEWVGLGEIGDAAMEYAKRRAGELIGMTYDPDSGTWTETTSAYRIDQTTRDQVETVLTNGLDEGLTIDELRTQLDAVLENPGRAGVIARTEASYAYNHGTASNWEALGVTHVEIQDNEGPNSCEACAEANGQVWTVEYFLANSLEHPNCVRTAFPTDAPGA